MLVEGRFSHGEFPGASAEGTPEIDWFFIGSGGGSESGGDYTLDATIGQPLVGESGNGDLALCSGYWCLVQRVYRALLPILFR